MWERKRLSRERPARQCLKRRERLLSKHHPGRRPIARPSRVITIIATRNGTSASTSGMPCTSAASPNLSIGSPVAALNAARAGLFPLTTTTLPKADGGAIVRVASSASRPGSHSRAGARATDYPARQHRRSGRQRSLQPHRRRCRTATQHDLYWCRGNTDSCPSSQRIHDRRERPGAQDAAELPLPLEPTVADANRLTRFPLATTTPLASTAMAAEPEGAGIVRRQASEPSDHRTDRSRSGLRRTTRSLPAPPEPPSSLHRD